MMIRRWLNPRRIPGTLPGIHRGWARYLETLHAAGRGLELWLESLSDRLGDAALDPVHPATAMAMLLEYYRGDGDVDAGLRRMRSDRFVALPHRPATRARDLVALLSLAAPELGPLDLVRDDRGDLHLRTAGARAALARPRAGEHPLVSDPVYDGRRIAAREVVRATNELLAARALAYRFLPLDGEVRRPVFLGVDAEDALVLDGVDAFEAPLEGLRAFAQWERQTRVNVALPARRVA